MTSSYQPKRSPMQAVGRGVRYVVFLALLAVRRPVRLLLRLATILGALTGALLFLGAEGMRGMTITAFAVAFGAFVVGWFYDQLLLRLSPEPLILAQ